MIVVIPSRPRVCLRTRSGCYIHYWAGRAGRGLATVGGLGYKPKRWFSVRRFWGRFQLQRQRYWTVLKTKQASSGDAVRNVHSQNFPTYHPMTRERRDRGVRRVSALFPYYLLVSINVRRDNWKALASTRGVSRLFMSGSVPARVADEHVDHFRSLENSLGYIEIEENEAPRFDPEQSVVPTSGMFQDKYGIYKGLAGNRGDRAKVLFTILGIPTLFEVDAHALVAA